MTKMTTLKDEIRLISRKGEDGFTLRESEYFDLERHIKGMEESDTSFWSGLQWSFAGGFFTALTATGGYHLFDTSANGTALAVGYVVASALFVMSLMLGLRQRGQTPSFTHHKQEALIILKRVSAEKWREADFGALPEGQETDERHLPAVDINLFTDLRNTKDKLG